MPACGSCPASPATRRSLAEESFASGLLEYPHYTRPRDWEGRTIPEVLLSGDHKKIAEWRREQAEKLTEAAPARSVASAIASANLDRGQSRRRRRCYQV